MKLSELFADESRWLKHTGREVRNGKECFCLFEACMEFLDSNQRYAIRQNAKEQFPNRGHQGIVNFNDHSDTTIDDIRLVVRLTEEQMEKDNVPTDA